MDRVGNEWKAQTFFFYFFYYIYCKLLSAINQKTVLPISNVGYLVLVLRDPNSRPFIWDLLKNVKQEFDFLCFSILQLCISAKCFFLVFCQVRMNFSDCLILIYYYALPFSLPFRLSFSICRWLSFVHTWDWSLLFLKPKKKDFGFGLWYMYTVKKALPHQRILLTLKNAPEHSWSSKASIIHEKNA